MRHLSLPRSLGFTPWATREGDSPHQECARGQHQKVFGVGNLKSGATLLKEPKQVPTGMNMLAKHPDGTRIEYVQHVKEQVDGVNLTRSEPCS